MKKFGIIVLMMLVSLSVTFAQKIAVLDFKAGVGITQIDVDGLSSTFVTYFNPRGYQLVERSQINQVIEEQGFQKTTLTESQMVRLGQIMNLSKIVVGDVNIVGGSPNLDVRVIDVQSGEVTGRDGATFAWTNYRTTMQQLAEKVAGQIGVVYGGSGQSGYSQPSGKSASGEVETILGYLKVYPEDLGTFNGAPTSVIAAVNRQKLNGYGDWRLPTNEELSLMMTRKDILGIGNVENYMSTENASSGRNRIVRLVTTGKNISDIQTINTTGPKYGTDSVNCIENLANYRELYKQWEASKFSPGAFNNKMVKYWREVVFNCPRASQFPYTNGEKIMDYFIRTYPKDKDAYIDTICMLIDMRAQYFPIDPKTGESQVPNIMCRKGLFIYNYNSNRYEEAYNVLKDAVALDASQLQGAYIDAYFKATIDMVNNNKAEKMTIINVYQELSEVVDNNISVLAETETELVQAKEDAEAAGDTEAVAGFDKQIEKNEKTININKGVKSNLDNLFQPYASCDDLIKVFTAKMAETPDDVVLLKRITTILDKKDCTDSKLFLDAAVKLNELEPSPEASYSLGIKFFKDKKWSDAATFFDQATKTENNDRKYRAYRNLGMCYQNMGNLSRARDIFRRAAQVDPTNGEPYLLIGMLYAESAKQFSGEIESKAVFWAAVDKCNKAKAVDPSCSEKANGLIRAYTAAFPSMETIFFNDYNEGQSFQVGGWIGETTTIRAKK